MRTEWVRCLGIMVPVLLAGCATTIEVHEPVLCPAWTEQTQADYEQLKAFQRAEELRSWIISTGQVCRANAAMRGDDW